MMEEQLLGNRQLSAYMGIGEVGHTERLKIGKQYAVEARKQQRKEAMNYITKYKSPLGVITLASDGENLTGLWFDGQKYDRVGCINPEIKDELLIFHTVKDWLDAYFRGENPKIEKISLKPSGTEFRQKVWQELLKIPYGEVITYGEIGHRLGIRSGQAVGGAVGRNPISILIPCHRVVGKNKSLTGYAGGIEKKEYLLKIEQRETAEEN